MIAVVCSTQPNFVVPLAALLREVDVEVHATGDVFEALERIRATPNGALIIDAGLESSDVILAVRGARRHLGARHLLVVIGADTNGAPASEANDSTVHEAWVEEAFAFVDIRDRLARHAADARTESTGQPAPHTAGAPRIRPPETDLQPSAYSSPIARATRADDIADALETARTGSYHACLGVTRGATTEDCARAAGVQRVRFHRDALEDGLVDVHVDELREIRATIDDAEAVLTDPIARRWYERGLDASRHRE